MDLAARPASKYPLADLVSLLNRGFEDYLIPIHFSNTTFLAMLRRDSIDLAVSRVLLADDEPCGIALVAPRGARRISRLAAMGIAREARGRRAGSWFMERLIEDAARRRDRDMVLEVIEQNEPAVRLYRQCGFESVRRLIGFTCKQSGEGDPGSLEEIDLRDMGRLITDHGLADLPWQLSSESIVQLDPAARVYRHGPAYLAISNPESSHIVIWSLLVEPAARGQGLGAGMLGRVRARHPGKTWHVPALCPEEYGRVFERAGFERDALSQWQMTLRVPS